MKVFTPNQRGAGKGGIAVLWRAGRAWPALPDRDRLPAQVAGKRVDEPPPARLHADGVSPSFPPWTQGVRPTVGTKSDGTTAVCDRRADAGKPVDGADRQDAVPCAGMSAAGGSSTR